MDTPQYITIPLSEQSKNQKKYFAIISTQDADLSKLRWSSRNNGKYAHRMIKTDGQKKFVSLHKAVMERKLGRELRRGEYIDHINRNGLDNRRENLRIVTHAQNHANRVKQSNNTSGYKGVTFSRRRNKWQAQIGVDGESIYLGYFDNPEDAYQAYCEAADKYHGEFANYGDTE